MHALESCTDSIFAAECRSYLVEWGVLTGTLLHESLPRYFALKDKGAFKGAGGGLQKAFMNGPDPADVSAAAKMLNVRIQERK